MRYESMTTSNHAEMSLRNMAPTYTVAEFD